MSNEQDKRFVDWTPLNESPHQLNSNEAGPPEEGTTREAEMETQTDSTNSPQTGVAEAEERRSEDRRGGDRRESIVDRRLGLDRRRGPGRRRSTDRRSAEEGQMSDEQFEFLMAIDQYKKANARPFPTWTEVLEVIKALGYRKTAEPSELAESKKNSEEKT